MTLSRNVCTYHERQRLRVSGLRDRSTETSTNVVPGVNIVKENGSGSYV